MTFERDNRVRVHSPRDHNRKFDRMTGTVVGVLQEEGDPHYLVKVDSEPDPVEFEKDELELAP